MLETEGYITSIGDSLKGCKKSLAQIQDELSVVKHMRNRLFVLGNGGSLAIAQHFAQDLLKLCNVKAMALNCPSMITAHANDDGFDYVYFNQVLKLIEPEDVIFIFSCSGKSRNYIEFVSGFPNMKNTIISVVGTDGGFLKEKSNIALHVNSNDYQICETAFCVVADLLVKSLMDK